MHKSIFAANRQLCNNSSSSIKYKITMTRKLFGTDGIRGPAGIYPLDRDGCYQIGKAIGTYFAKPGQNIVVGCDPRESSPSIAGSLINGIMDVGVTCINAGVLPTPGLAYLANHKDVVAGVMVTASHNPYTDNGIKIFSSDGGKLPDNVEAELNKLIDQTIESTSNGQIIDGKDYIGGYIDYLVSLAPDGLNGIKLAIDAANGATSSIVHEVFERLKSQNTILNNRPDGKNINVECGATDTRGLQRYVTSNHLEAGIAFDGDGDRLIMIDARGRKVTGDHILYILAVTMKQKAVVATTMSNIGFENSLASKDINLIRVDVGDRYVLDGLAKHNLIVGGEQSGHIIINNLTTTGDGIQAAIVTLKNVIESGKSLEEWYDELKLMPQALTNIGLPSKDLLYTDEVQSYINDQNTKFGNKGRLNIRASGTEPLLRIMVESDDAEAKAKAIANELANIINSKVQK